MLRKTTLLAAFTLALWAPTQAFAEKKCTETYHPGGIRCTFCYYTTQPDSGSTVCIKLPTPRRNSSPMQSFSN